MKRFFALRIDIESDKGIKKGIPKILDMLKKYKFKASFYLVMGGESNLFELLKYRKKILGERKIKIFSKLELIRMILFPRDFVKENKKILKKILNEGHELGIHGWKHRPWTRGLNKINIKKHLILSINKYKKIFNKKPSSFVSPGFKTNKNVIKELDKYNFRIISDFPGKTPFKLKGTKIINVPITINGKNNIPIIEYLVTKGYSDDRILQYLKKEIKKKKYSTIYIHDLFECIYKIDLLEKLFKFIKKEKIKVKTIKKIADEKRKK